MADSASKNPLSGLKKMSPQARKGMLVFGVAGGVVLALTALWASNRGGEAVVPASVQTAGVPEGDSDPTAAVSPEYKKLVDEAERKRFNEAADVPGKMVLPSMVGLTDANTKPDASQSGTVAINPAAQQAPQAQSVPQGAPMAPVKTPQMEQSEQAQYAAMMKHFGRVADSAFATGAGLSVILPQGATGAGSVGQQGVQSPVPVAQVGGLSGAQIGGQAVPTGSAASAPVPSDPPLLQAGVVSFATLDTAINTDFSGPVFATLHDGKFKNARLAGTKSLEHDAVVLRFSSLSPANGGRAIPIEAYAIRIDDARKFGLTGLVGRTDYHFFERYVLPAAAVFTQTYGTLAAQPEQTLVQTQDGIVQQTPKISKRDRMIASTGSAMQPIISDLTRAGTRPITQELDANTEIGVLFARDVVPADSQSAMQAIAPVGQVPQAPAQGPTPQAPLIQPAQYPVPAQPVYGYPRPAQPGVYGQYPAYGQYNAYQR